MWSGEFQGDGGVLKMNCEELVTIYLTYTKSLNCRCKMDGLYGI